MGKLTIPLRREPGGYRSATVEIPPEAGKLLKSAVMSPDHPWAIVIFACENGAYAYTKAGTMEKILPLPPARPQAPEANAQPLAPEA